MWTTALPDNLETIWETMNAGSTDDIRAQLPYLRSMVADSPANDYAKKAYVDTERDLLAELEAQDRKAGR
jgi:hypothetical protein